MAIDATFWVAVSFIIFFGALIYLKIPQKISVMLDKMISDIKNEIDDLIGNSYSFFEKIKKGGVGSGKLLITKANKELNWFPEITLEDGLKKTIKWVENSID